MKCNVEGCESTDLVYSGVDAFCLQVPTEKYCYACSNRGVAQELENALRQ